MIYTLCKANFFFLKQKKRYQTIFKQIFFRRKIKNLIGKQFRNTRIIVLNQELLGHLFEWDYVF